MLRFPVPAVLHGDALTSELNAAGISAHFRVEGDELVVVGTDDRAGVQQVLDAHNPASDFGVPDEDRQLRLLRAKAQEVKAGTGTFTAAQMQKILAHLILRATRK